MQNIYNSVYMHIVYSTYAIYKNTYYVRRAAGGGDIVYLHTPKPTLTDGYSSRTQTHTHTHSFVRRTHTYIHTYIRTWIRSTDRFDPRSDRRLTVISTTNSPPCRRILPDNYCAHGFRAAFFIIYMFVSKRNKILDEKIKLEKERKKNNRYFNNYCNSTRKLDFGNYVYIVPIYTAYIILCLPHRRHCRPTVEFINRRRRRRRRL